MAVSVRFAEDDALLVLGHGLDGICLGLGDGAAADLSNSYGMVRVLAVR